jgi:hypothetical protein
VISLAILTASFVACGGNGPDGPDADAVVTPDVAADVASDVRTDVRQDVATADVTDIIGDSADIPTDVDDDSGDESDVFADVADVRDVVGVDTEDQDTGIPVPSFHIVENGVSSHVIVVADTASLSEKTAANEMQALFLEATGVTMPIVAAPESAETPRIVVGAGVEAIALGVDPDPADLGEQGFVLKSVPPSIVIAGSPAAGTMYGVHRFLEEALHVRWIAPGVTIVPPATDVVFPEAADRLEKPAFEWRQNYYAFPGADAAFMAHIADNAGSAAPDSAYGVQHYHDGIAHSYFSYISPDEFWDTHPEYFSEIGGVRVREETQLCLTNSEVLDIVTERMRARMLASPAAIQHNFSQMDHYNQCECDNCRAMNDLYQSKGGTQFWFVSELAKRLETEFPNKQIGTLAYMYTEEPPVGLDMHPNVAVWLCHMYPSCDSHPIRTCADNADYKRRAEAWGQVTNHLYIWHYIVDFMHYYNPFPNFFALADNLKFYRDIGVEGIFAQGMNHAGGGGEFSVLRPWFGAKLLWNPDLDPKSLIKRFLKDYYGAAWGPIWDWMVLLQDKVDSEDIHMHLYTNPAQGYLTEDIVVTGEALFDEAAQLVAGDPVLEDRVEVARMPLGYARFFPRNGYRIEDGMLTWNPGMATFDEVQFFIQQMSDHGFTTMREAQGTPDTMTMLYMIIGVDQPVNTIKNDHIQVDVVPALAGRALRITDIATGKTITAWDQRRNLFFPFSGGLEDRVGEGFNFMGWVEPGTALNVTARSLKITMNTMNGFKLTRILEIDPDEPILRVTSTVTNPGASPVEARLRQHLELNLGDLASTEMAFVARDGSTVAQGMEGILAGQREGEHYYDQSTPAGEWEFTGTKGLKVIHRFDNDAVDFTWLYAFPERDQELEMEVFAKRKLLNQNESVTLTTEIEIRPVL